MFKHWASHVFEVSTFHFSLLFVWKSSVKKFTNESELCSEIAFPFKGLLQKRVCEWNKVGRSVFSLSSSYTVVYSTSCACAKASVWWTNSNLHSSLWNTHFLLDFFALLGSVHSLFYFALFFGLVFFHRQRKSSLSYQIFVKGQNLSVVSWGTCESLKVYY